MTAAASPLVGVLQIRVMNHIWTHGPSTVHAVHDAINAEETAAGRPTKAYTTILTVMRNLRRAGLLTDSRLGGRSFTFTATTTRDHYRATVATWVLKTFFDDNQATFQAALAEGVPAAGAS